MTAIQQIALHLEEVLSTVDFQQRPSAKSRWRVLIKQQLKELKNTASAGHPNLEYLLKYDLPQSREMLLELTWEAVCQNQEAPLEETLYHALNKPQLKEQIANEYAGNLNRAMASEVNLAPSAIPLAGEPVTTQLPMLNPNPTPPTQEPNPSPTPPTQELNPSPTPHTQELNPNPTPPTQELNPNPTPPTQEPNPQQSLIERLWQEGYRMASDLQWHSKGEAYSGLAMMLQQDFSQAAQKHPPYAPLFEAQVAEVGALAQAQRLPLEDINPTPSDPWMPTAVIEAYLKHRSGEYGDYQVSKVDGAFVVKYRHVQQKRLERLLNKKHLASEVAEFESFQKDFYDFLLQNDLREVVEEAYNSLGNGFLQEQWPQNPIHVNLQGWNPAITPHPWQNEVAGRTLLQGNLINALDVGLGKTLATILTVLKAKQDGWARRVLIATPANVIAKWYHEIKRAKPDARVLVVGATLEDGWREISGVKELSQQLALAMHQDFDLILMTHTTLGRIPMEATHQKALIQSEFNSSQGRKMPNPIYEDHLLMQVQQMLQEGRLDLERMQYTLSHSQEILDDIKDPKQKAQKKAEIAFMSKASHLLHKAANAIPKLAYTFESLSVDFLVIDEAHNFKALWELEARHSVRYMGRTVSSQRACDLLYKVRSVQQNNHGHGVLLLTATPMVNGPTELYNMISLVAPHLFERIGIHNVSDFVDHYCLFGTEEYLDDNNELKSMKVLKGLNHVKELRQLALGVIHKRTAKDVGLQQPESTPQYLIYPAQAEQEKAIAFIANHPLEALNTYMGLAIGQEDLERYRLVIAHLLKRAELDMEMLDPHTYKGYISPKVKGWIKEVVACVKRGEKVVTFVDTTEMPSPQGVNPHGYSFHQKLKDLLVEYSPLQPSQIAIVNATSTPTPLSRYQVSQDLAASKVKVVIGNTATMGEGMDLQIDVANLLRLEIPWNRAKFDQQSGRVKRQGNHHAQINEKIFMGSRGLDVTMMDVLRGKTSWYQAFWEGQDDTLSTLSEDIIPSLDMIRCLAIARESEREMALQQAAQIEQQQIAMLRMQKGLGLMERYQKVYQSYLNALAKGRNSQAKQILQSANRIRTQIEALEELKPYHALLEDPQSYLVLGGVIAVGQTVRFELKYTHRRVLGKVLAIQEGVIKLPGGDLRANEVLQAQVLEKQALLEEALQHDPSALFDFLREDPSLLLTLKTTLTHHPMVVWSQGEAIYQEAPEPLTPLAALPETLTPLAELPEPLTPLAEPQDNAQAPTESKRGQAEVVWPDHGGAIPALSRLLNGLAGSQQQDSRAICQQIRKQGFKVTVVQQYTSQYPYVHYHYSVESPLAPSRPFTPR